jgi:3-oxoadipate enol-lactonase
MNEATRTLRTVEVNGTTLVLDEAGAGQTTLLLLHGAYLSHRAWQPQRDVLGEDYHLLLPDLRGHGESGRHGQPYKVEELAADMAALVKTLDIRRLAIVGHSLGGMVAQAMLLDYELPVCALVLAETSFGTRSTWYEALLTDLSKPLIKWTSIRWQARMYARMLGKQSEAARDYLLEEIGAQAEEPDNYHAVWDAVTAFDSKDRLAEIEVPTLVLVAELNKQTHSQGRKMAKRIPHAQLDTVPNAGHMLSWDNVSGFNQRVLAFLREHC